MKQPADVVVFLAETQRWERVYLTEEGRRRLFALRGVAWSDDRLAAVVCGPCGQLVDIELSPSLFRRLDAKGLETTIVATASAAVQNVDLQLQEILDNYRTDGIDEGRSR